MTTKPFKIEDGVSSGGGSSETNGTITGTDIDISTGNSFSYSQTGDTTFTFSNPAASGNTSDFTLKLDATSTSMQIQDAKPEGFDRSVYNPAGVTTGNVRAFRFGDSGNKFYSCSSNTGYQFDLSTAYNIDTLTYNSKSFNFSTQDANPRGLTFKSDGTKMYMVGSSTDQVYQYTLSTAWDISSAIYDTVSLDVSLQTGVPEDVFIGNSGSTLFVVGTNSTFQYTLTTPWDLSTASYDSVSLSGTQTNGLTFNPTGTKLTVAKNTGIYHHTLSTGWDLSTAGTASSESDLGLSNVVGCDWNGDGTEITVSLALGAGSVRPEFATRVGATTAYEGGTVPSLSHFFRYNSQEGSAQIVSWNDDGTKMFIAGRNGDDINEYSLSTAYDASTATFTDATVIPSSNNPSNGTFSADGTKFYNIDNDDKLIYQYTLSTAWDASTISYDSVTLDTTAIFNPESMTFKRDDGTKLYIATGSQIYQYSLTTGWDLSTASYDSIVVNPPIFSFVDDIHISNDGLYMVALRADIGYLRLLGFPLTTAFDLSTMSTTLDQSTGTGQENNGWSFGFGASCFAFNADETQVLVAETDRDTVASFSIGTAAPFTTTWPSSVKFAGGTAPTGPGDAETDTLRFITRDGGTTYYGYRKGDNFS